VAVLTDRLELACGLVLENRLVRAAMTEGLADARNDPTVRHERLYAAATGGGAGMVLTGNAMVDRRHLERARNVVIDAMTDQAALKRWAAACSHAPTLVQLSHPGRQTNRFVQPHPVAPSGGPAVHVAGMFARPRALTLVELKDVARRFRCSARRAVAAGFPGVQVHAAHGYLMSSFLDPARNHRSDGYGGDLQGRARLLLEVVRGLRSELPAGAAVAVKLDARVGADGELVQLAAWLQDEGVDLLEISGGSYESPAMLGLDPSGGALRPEHESPFWDSAAAVAHAVRVPVMLTGGFRTRAAIDSALGGGVASLVGVARPLAVRPQLAAALLRGEVQSLDRPAPRLGGPASVRRVLGGAAGAGWYRLQLARTGAGKGPWLGLPALAAALDYSMLDIAQAILARPGRMRLAASVERAAVAASCG